MHEHFGIKCPSPRKKDCDAKTRAWKAMRKAESVAREAARVDTEKARREQVFLDYEASQRRRVAELLEWSDSRQGVVDAVSQRRVG